MGNNKNEIQATPVQTPTAVVPRTSRQIPAIIPAGTMVNGQIQPGQTFVAGAGTEFYVLSTTGTVSICPVRAGNIGITNAFQTGQGQKVSASFDQLLLSNPTTATMVVVLWVGYDEFINNQLILAQTVTQQVAYPTYSTASTKPNVAINDLSGTIFTDINGTQWGAISRVAIMVFNLDTGVTLLLQKAGATGPSAPAVGAIPPSLAIRFDFGGNYVLNLGGANINAIVSEIYSAVSLSTTPNV